VTSNLRRVFTRSAIRCLRVLNYRCEEITHRIPEIPMIHLSCTPK
jgi:hypothetical protein